MLFFRNPVTAWNVAGMVLASLGIVLYNTVKQSDPKAQPAKIADK
jgi:hypothetical protein